MYWQRGGNLVVDAEQFFHRERVGDVVGQRREIIQPVRVRDELGVGHVLGDFFVAAMQITHVRVGLGDDFAVQLQHDAQHAVRGRMRRPHVQDHLLALHVLKLFRRLRSARGGIANFNVLNGGHENYFFERLSMPGSAFRTRTRGSRRIASPLLRQRSQTARLPAASDLVNATPGSSRRLAGQREILAQRKIRIAFPHQNPAQIRMAAETDAHHVVNFALVPVGRAPDVSDARQLGFFLAHVGFEPQFVAVVVRPRR